MITTLVLLHVLAKTSVAAQQSVLLRYKFHVGQTRTYKTVLDYHMDVETNGQKMPVVMVMSSEAKQTVKSVSSTGAAVISISIFDQQVEMTFKGDKHSIPMPEIKEPIEITMAPNGLITRLDSKKTFGNDTSSLLAGGFALASVQMIGALPNDQVTEGSHWNPQTSALSAKPGLTIQLDKLVADGPRTIANITASGNMDMGKIFGAIGAGQNRSMDGSMKGDFHSEFDVTNGRLLDMRADLTIDVNVGDKGDSGSSGSMKETGTVTMNVNLVDLSD